jgi:hypothetical protein
MPKKKRPPLWFVEKVGDEERVTELCRGCGQTHMHGAKILRVSEKDFEQYVNIDKIGKLRSTVIWPTLAAAALFFLALFAIPWAGKEGLLPQIIVLGVDVSPEALMLTLFGLIVLCVYPVYRPLRNYNRRVLESREGLRRGFLAGFGGIPSQFVHTDWFLGMGPRDYLLLPEGINNELDYARFRDQGSSE